MKKILALTVLFLLAARATFAQQDAQYSQYMFNGIYINPAYAGYKEVLNIHSYYRAQWTGMEGAPRSFSVAVDGVTNDGNVGMGVQVSGDKLGAQSTQSVYASYAYRIRLNEEGTSRLSLGLSGGLVQAGIDGNLLNTLEPETHAPVGKQTSVVPDARAGIYYASERFFAGLSASNILASRMSKAKFVNIPQPRMHFYLTGGMVLPVNENIYFRPSFLVKDDPGGPSSLDINAFLIFQDKIWVGGSYRSGVKLYEKPNLQLNIKSQNAAVAAVEIFPLPELRIGYAYDFAVGALQSYNNGSHEISVAFSLSQVAAKAKGLVACPKFF